MISHTLEEYILRSFIYYMKYYLKFYFYKYYTLSLLVFYYSLLFIYNFALGSYREGKELTGKNH